MCTVVGKHFFLFILKTIGVPTTLRKFHSLVPVRTDWYPDEHSTNALCILLDFNQVSRLCDPLKASGASQESLNFYSKLICVSFLFFFYITIIEYTHTH